ncbi:helix-turn-helix domain-containing protein [Methyloversatilis sp.]|uniref:helix-turn-helix domain-containing protein n=1 Tax=Methyloversatilis sp. TaxID=2569862 RepID=UPI002733C1CC|nr:helix-turn-helix domain-containing protein [Methyloversatilis sp.]
MARNNVLNAHINGTRIRDMERTSAPKKASQANDWHPADIVAALRKAGWSVRGLAHRHSVTPTTISRAMRQSSAANEKRIAEALKLDPKLIWPSRYNADGSRKLQGFQAIRQCTRETVARNGKDRAAA